MEDVIRKINLELHIKDDNDNKQSAENIKSDSVFSMEQTLEKAITNPFLYLMSQRGNTFRHDLIAALNYWHKRPESVTNTIGQIVYIYYNSSLLIDDIQDAFTLRKGNACAHLIYGIPNTINAVSYVVAKSLQQVNSELKTYLANTYMEAIRGQAMEIHWRDNLICPTEDQYHAMALKKTGSIMYFVHHAVQLYSEVRIDTLPLITAMALFFQINDDYLNLNSEEYQKTKGFCQDITEGKFTYPILYVVNNFPEEGKQIVDILRQRTSDLEPLSQCKSIIEKCGGLEYTKEAIKKFKAIAEDERSKLGPNPLLDKLMEDLRHNDFLVIA